MSRRYDSRTTTFTPDGRLQQIEYAVEAINKTGSAIGTSSLSQESSLNKESSLPLKNIKLPSYLNKAKFLRRSMLSISIYIVLFLDYQLMPTIS